MECWGARFPGLMGEAWGLAKLGEGGGGGCTRECKGVSAPTIGRSLGVSLSMGKVWGGAQLGAGSGNRGAPTIGRSLGEGGREGGGALS
jgi:hypothetical protein